jgi:putative transcriptional regulator
MTATKKPKRNIGAEILEGARQALAFARGEHVPGMKVHIPDEINVARIRKKLELSQGKFADAFGLPVRTVQQWEQGRAMPHGAARVLLTLIDREPEAVSRALLQQDKPRRVAKKSAIKRKLAA